MSNKLNKILISLLGLMAVGLGVMGLKFEKEAKDIQNLQASLQASLASAEKVRTMIELQNQMETARMENLKKVDTAQVGTKTEIKTQTVVIPGKTVPQTTTKTTTSKTSSSKTTKSS